MKYIFLLTILLVLIPSPGNAQEIRETNTDIIYQKALEAYRSRQYQSSLDLTQRGLELAPEYHDIRILQIRNYWALENYAAADADLEHLLAYAPNYTDVPPLVHQRINRFREPAAALLFIDRVSRLYPEQHELQVRKVQLLLKTGEKKKARELAMNLIRKKGVSGEERYILQTILNRTVTNEVGINYQYISFSDDYNRSDSWNTISTEYQHNINRTAFIGRVTYADRGYDQGTLYEIEAYPVINEGLYFFTNIGFSADNFFPEFRSSASLFLNFARIFEAEAGGRILVFNNTSYFSGIVGLTAYSGQFYFNARSFLGPERQEQLIQNYQFNLRYYLTNADNYFFFRLGSGISPDETALFTRVQENPLLEARYGNLGINKTFGVHHIFQLGAGLLYEDLSSEKQGTQFIGTAGYRYRF